MSKTYKFTFCLIVLLLIPSTLMAESLEIVGFGPIHAFYSYNKLYTIYELEYEINGKRHKYRKLDIGLDNNDLDKTFEFMQNKMIKEMMIRHNFGTFKQDSLYYKSPRKPR